ncbi:MAG: hypothetical protein WDO69_05630 [Pseudomonadota bacterium]
MIPLVVVVTAEQLGRLNQLCESSGFTQDEQVGALIDLDWEEWQDAIGQSRSSRFAKFARLEAAQAKDGGVS